MLRRKRRSEGVGTDLKIQLKKEEFTDFEDGNFKILEINNNENDMSIYFKHKNSAFQKFRIGITLYQNQFMVTLDSDSENAKILKNLRSAKEFIIKKITEEKLYRLQFILGTYKLYSCERIKNKMKEVIGTYSLGTAMVIVPFILPIFLFLEKFYLFSILVFLNTLYLYYNGYKYAGSGRYNVTEGTKIRIIISGSIGLCSVLFFIIWKLF